jgi:CDP-4-dehydro-6-deoxyglucose reductase, E1
MLAHTLGDPFNLAAVKNIAGQHNLSLIEDCCDALGATLDGKPVGTLGGYGDFEFYSARHITMGEGGVVMMNRIPWTRLVEFFHDRGRDCWCPPGKDNTCEKCFDWKLDDLSNNYDHKYIYSHLDNNMKQTEMNATVGLSQLAKADKFIESCKESYLWFFNAFRQAEYEEHFILSEAMPGSNPSWFGFLLTIRESSPLVRRVVVAFLESHRVGTRLLFAGNIAKQPAFLDVDYRTPVPLTNSDTIMNNSFWIGVSPGIKLPQRNHIVEAMEMMIKGMA